MGLPQVPTNQVVFELQRTAGTLVEFWCLSSARITVPVFPCISPVTTGNNPSLEMEPWLLRGLGARQNRCRSD